MRWQMKIIDWKNRRYGGFLISFFMLNVYVGRTIRRPTNTEHPPNSIPKDKKIFSP